MQTKNNLLKSSPIRRLLDFFIEFKRLFLVCNRNPHFIPSKNYVIVFIKRNLQNHYTRKNVGGHKNRTFNGINKTSCLEICHYLPVYKRSVFAHQPPNYVQGNIESEAKRKTKTNNHIDFTVGAARDS